MRPFSMDLRERIFRAYCQRQEPVQALAQRFDVSEGFIYKMRRQEQALGHLEPMPHGGGYPPILNSEKEALLCQWIKAKPDATLDELANRLLQEQKIKVSRPTLSRVLSKLGLARKKKELCGSGAQGSSPAGVYGLD